MAKETTKPKPVIKETNGGSGTTGTGPKKPTK